MNVKEQKEYDAFTNWCLVSVTVASVFAAIVLAPVVQS
jgi:hypothetical protein